MAEIVVLGAGLGGTLMAYELAPSAARKPATPEPITSVSAKIPGSNCDRNGIR